MTNAEIHHIVKIFPAESRQRKPQSRDVFPELRTNIRPDQTNTATSPVNTLVPKKSESPMEQIVLREISKNYILIPKIRPECVYEDETIHETLPITKDEWKSKYDILNKIGTIDHTLKKYAIPEKDLAETNKDSVNIPNEKDSKFGELHPFELKSYNMVRNADFETKVHDQQNQNRTDSDSSRDAIHSFYIKNENDNTDGTEISKQICDKTEASPNFIESKSGKLFDSTNHSLNDPKLADIEQTVFFSKILANTEAVNNTYLSEDKIPEPYVHQTYDESINNDCDRTKEPARYYESNNEKSLPQQETSSPTLLSDKDHYQYSDKVQLGYEQTTVFDYHKYSDIPDINKEKNQNQSENLGIPEIQENVPQSYNFQTGQTPHDVIEEQAQSGQENFDRQYMLHNLSKNNTQYLGGLEQSNYVDNAHGIDKGNNEKQNGFQNREVIDTDGKSNITQVEEPQISNKGNFQNNKEIENVNVDQNPFQRAEQGEYDQQSPNPVYQYQNQFDHNSGHLQYQNEQYTPELSQQQTNDPSQYHHTEYGDTEQNQYPDQHPEMISNNDSQYVQNYDQQNDAYQNHTQGHCQSQEQEQYQTQEQGHYESQERGNYQSEGQEQYQFQEEGQYQSQEREHYQTDGNGVYQIQDEGQYQSQDQAEHLIQECDQNYIQQFKVDQGQGEIITDPKTNTEGTLSAEHLENFPAQ